MNIENRKFFPRYDKSGAISAVTDADKWIIGVICEDGIRVEVSELKGYEVSAILDSIVTHLKHVMTQEN